MDEKSFKLGQIVQQKDDPSQRAEVLELPRNGLMTLKRYNRHGTIVRVDPARFEAVPDPARAK